MEKIFWNIFLCIFISSSTNCDLIKLLSNDDPPATMPNLEQGTGNFGYSRVLVDNGKTETTAPLLISGAPKNMTDITIDGTISDIKNVLRHRSPTDKTPLLIHATGENSTYLLTFITLENSTDDILVYIDIGNEMYILIGTMKNTATSGKSISKFQNMKTFVVDFFDDIVDKVKDGATSIAAQVVNTAESVIGVHILVLKGVVNALCPAINVSFLLYTKSNPDEYQVLKLSEANSIRNSNFNPSKKTTVLVHGWKESGSEDELFAKTMKDAILKSDDRNIIVIGWPAKSLYSCSLGAMKPVAKIVADFLQILNEKHNVDMDSFHVIGHGLGAHIAGFSGKYLTTGRLSRITGLDPAGPLISCNNKDNCINKSDARFVDIIHTDGGYLGKSEPLGHADFYPNGGKFFQPNCGLLPPWCSHRTSYLFYAEAISSGNNGPKFYAAKSNSYEKFKSGVCSDMNEMGPNVNEEITGKFYLITGSRKPYALGMRGIGKRCSEALNITSN